MSSLPSKRDRTEKKPRRAKVDKKKIAAALAAIDAIVPPTLQAARTFALLKSWLADESGYDERTWPELKASIDRDRLSSRRLFDG